MEIKINGTWKKKINIINNSIIEVTWKRNAKGSFRVFPIGSLKLIMEIKHTQKTPPTASPSPIFFFLDLLQ